ncbi:MAG: SDR family NAD(P)-dependent oxidoreductase [Acidimicrobiales bacterium]
MDGAAANVELSPLKRALLAIEDMRARVEAAERAAHEPIAILGMGCRMPGSANDPAALWQLLIDGVDAIREIPRDRWDIDDFHDPDPDIPGKIVSRDGGFIDNVDLFDPQFFGISPREAVTMDPQQRLLLEVSWEALEAAGIAPASLGATKTGVYVGMGIYDYAHVAREGMESSALDLDAYVGTGNSASVAAGRISFALGLQGPAMAVDTACSSSLVSVHLACQALRTGEADLAIAGGASLILTPGTHLYMSQMRALSPTGRCRTFDASADGYVRSEGAAMIVLKRLSDAVADGDSILAVIRGTAVNHDGRSSGLTVPNGIAQQAVIRAALEDARVDPQDVSYVEAHGTGTPLGDPIEVRALDAVYGAQRHEPLQIGSVKTNIGHLESASGIAGLLKVVLALQHDRIPPHLHLSEPTPHLEWDEMAIEVPTTARSWPRGERPRIGGINSFGLSGTNSHILISDPPPVVAPSAPSDEPDRPTHVLTLSARSGVGLRELAGTTARALTARNAPGLPDAAYTLNTGRNAFGHRLAVVAATAEEAAAALERFVEDAPSPDLVARDLGTLALPKLAFLFTGQGSQYAGMGQALYEVEPTFRAALDRCDAILRDHLDRPLLSVIHPAPDTSSPIDDTTYTQPALFALEYALATMWHAWGVTPHMMLGHSIGSYVAAHLAGVMSLEDALVLVATRGRLMGSLPAGGSMASVFASDAVVAEVVATLGGQLSIAAINGPDNTVISGPHEQVRAAIDALAGAGIDARPLTTSHAFHSELMEPILAEFGRVAADVAMQPPHGRRMVSDMTGTIAGAEVASAAYWVEHLRRAVRFADGMTTLAQEGCNVFLEVGPAPILSAMGRRCLPDAHVVWAASLQPKRPDVARTALALGELWTAGVDVSWGAFDGRHRRRRVVMPTAPFQRQRYWVPASESRASATALSTGHPLLGVEVVAPVGPMQFESGISAHRPSFLNDRLVHGRVEIGAATFVESAFAAARELWGATDALEVAHLVVDEPIVVDSSALRYGTAVEIQSRTVASVAVRVADVGGHSWNLAATATVARVALDDIARLVPPAFRPPVGEGAAAASELFETWRESGLVLGPRAQCIDAMWSSASTATVRIALPFGADRFSLYPPLLEACALALLAGNPRGLRGIERVRLVSDEPPAWCVRDLSAPDDDTLWFFDADGQVVAVADGFTFRELNLETAPPRADWVYDLTWRAIDDGPIPAGVRPAVPSGTWLLVGSDPRLDTIASGLADHRVPVRRLDGAALVGPDGREAVELAVDQALGATPPLSHVIVGPVGAITGDVPADTLAGGRALLRLTQVVTEAAWRRRVAIPPQLWLVTRGAIAVDGSDVTAPAEGALWGMLRTIATELPLFYGGMIDLDPEGTDDDVIDLITSSGDETWLARRAGRTHVARLRPSPPPATRPGRSIAVEGAQLVTGGFGALGLATARALVQRGARRLVLVGRSAVPPRASWSEVTAEDPARARVDAIRELEASGATVHVASFDVADRAALATFLAAYRAEGWPPIRGVFHTAGVLRDRSISDMTDDDVETVFGPKVQGTWNLHELLGGEPLEHFVLFSSAAGLLGSPGQANYGAANAFMDAVAHLRRRQGAPTLSVDWGAWAAGMADRDDLARQRGRQGQLVIPVDAGMALMFDLLTTEATQSLVMPMTRAQVAAAAASPLLSELVDATDIPTEADERRDRGAEILAAPAQERAAMMLAVLRTRVGGVLGLDADAVEPHSGLIELGLDSIMIVEMTTRLSIELGIGLNPREVFQETSVQSLAATLLSALGERAGASPAADANAGEPLSGSGCVLVVGAPGCGIAAVRTALAAAAPSTVDDGSAILRAATFADRAVALSTELAAQPNDLAALLDELPGLHIVHLVRHPFSSVAELAAELGQRGAEEVWRTVNGDLLDLAERLGPERVRMVRLEDLIEAGGPVDALLAIVGAGREVGDVGAAPVLDGERLDDWRTVELAERPGRGLRQIADELGYDTTWPLVEPMPTRGSGV